MKRIVQQVQWWIGLMLLPGLAGAAEHPLLSLGLKAEAGLGYNWHAQDIEALALVSVAEWGTVLRLPLVGVASTVTRTTFVVGAGLKLRELVETLGGTWTLGKDVALSTYLTVDPFSVKTGHTIWDTVKIGLGVSLIKF